jgi:hypothetical protein
MFEELNSGPCTATELARVDHDLSFHQVSRRISLLAIGGMIREAEDGGRGRRFELTEESRQATALIAGLGQWRERYAVLPEEAGLTAGEVAELLRATLPLVVLPNHSGRHFKLTVTSSSTSASNEEREIWAEVAADGVVASCAARPDPDGWGRGIAKEWTRTLLGSGGKIRTGGDGGPVVKACLQAMNEALWPRDSLLVPSS